MKPTLVSMVLFYFGVLFFGSLLSDGSDLNLLYFALTVLCGVMVGCTCVILRSVREMLEERDRLSGAENPDNDPQ